MSFSKNLKIEAYDSWEKGFNHPFIQELGKGILAKKTFQFYLLQDYLYLFEYAKVFALAATKSDNEHQLFHFVEAQYSILATELDLHRQYMLDYAIEKEEFNTVQPSFYNRSYTTNMLALGHSGGVAEIIAAILPCAWTYYDYASRLKKRYQSSLEKNPYRSWIDLYADPSFEKSFEWMFDLLDELAEMKSAKEQQKVKQIFISSLEFEYLFWEMSYYEEMNLIPLSE
ncbi:thiaminase II [Enterococcus hirae]|uniref:thiaminase II n=1 Tax=Enterococcus hirae TaxID=1354 RepID=UPI002DBC81AC|nr:thiaminase II [Enterococcus hirae]MEB7494582.1 thiaminase II [Enterococcus hirae]